MDSGLDDQLFEIGFHVVSPMTASERLSNDVPLGDGKDEITVGTIGDMNGMERCFVIIVDMDRAQTEDKALNQINLSKIYCACTRGMLHICLINEYIPDSWYSFFSFTESVAELPTVSSPISSEENDEIRDANTSNDGGLSTSEATNRPLTAVSSSSAVSKDDQQHEMIPVGVANDMFEGKKVFDPNVYQTRDYWGDKYAPKVKKLGRTTVFAITSPPIKSMEDVPTYYPLQKTVKDGMSENDACVYDGGIAENVPHMVTSSEIERMDDEACWGNAIGWSGLW